MKSAAKPITTSALSSATRRASFGVSRYGWTAVCCSVSACSGGVGREGSGAGGRVVVLAKELHLCRQLVPVRRPEQPAHDCIDRPREDEVEDNCRNQAPHDRSARCALPEHEVHDEQADL